MLVGPRHSQGPVVISRAAPDDVNDSFMSSDEVKESFTSLPRRDHPFPGQDVGKGVATGGLVADRPGRDEATGKPT
jgi:hypothetical protein